MASLAGNVPGFIWISQHKLSVFIFAGVMLTLGGALQWRARKRACPIDERKQKACKSSKAWSLYVYFTSLTLYLIGGFFAFVAPYIL